MITDEFTQFFVDNNFIVSVSIYGDATTHNRNRHYANGKGSYDKTMQGGKYGIYPPVIALVNTLPYNDRYFAMYDLKAYIDITLIANVDYAKEQLTGDYTCYTR